MQCLLQAETKKDWIVPCYRVGRIRGFLGSGERFGREYYCRVGSPSGESGD